MQQPCKQAALTRADVEHARPRHQLLPQQLQAGGVHVGGRDGLVIADGQRRVLAEGWCGERASGRLAVGRALLLPGHLLNPSPSAPRTHLVHVGARDAPVNIVLAVAGTQGGVDLAVLDHALPPQVLHQPALGVHGGEEDAGSGVAVGALLRLLVQVRGRGGERCGKRGEGER